MHDELENELENVLEDDISDNEIQLMQESIERIVNNKLMNMSKDELIQFSVTCCNRLGMAINGREAETIEEAVKFLDQGAEIALEMHRVTMGEGYEENTSKDEIKYLVSYCGNS